MKQANSDFKNGLIEIYNLDMTQDLDARRGSGTNWILFFLSIFVDRLKWIVCWGMVHAGMSLACGLSIFFLNYSYNITTKNIF